MTDQFKLAPADFTPAEKEALAKRTNSTLELAGVATQYARAFPLDEGAVAALVTQVYTLQSCFDALTDLLLDKTLLAAYPRQEGAPEDSPPPVGPCVLSRENYLEVSALKMDQHSRNLRQRMMAAGPSVFNRKN